MEGDCAREDREESAKSEWADGDCVKGIKWRLGWFDWRGRLCSSGTLGIGFPPNAAPALMGGWILWGIALWGFLSRALRERFLELSSGNLPATGGIVVSRPRDGSEDPCELRSMGGLFNGMLTCLARGAGGQAELAGKGDTKVSPSGPASSRS